MSDFSPCPHDRSRLSDLSSPLFPAAEVGASIIVSRIGFLSSERCWGLAFPRNIARHFFRRKQGEALVNGGSQRRREPYCKAVSPRAQRRRQRQALPQRPACARVRRAPADRSHCVWRMVAGSCRGFDSGILGFVIFAYYVISLNVKVFFWGVGSALAGGFLAGPVLMENDGFRLGSCGV